MNLVRAILGRSSKRRGTSEPDNAASSPDEQLRYGSEPQTGTSSRREFLARFGVGLAGIAAALAGVPIIGSFFGTQDRQQRIWQAVGPPADFPIGETVRVEFTDPDPVPWAGPAATNAAWIRRLGDNEFTAFSIFCTHTGCPVDWHGGANLFICPCHGGLFDRDGEVIAGPPESPLVRLDVRIRERQVEVRAAPVPVTGEISRGTRPTR